EDLSSLPDTDKIRIQAEALRRLMEEIVKQPTLELGLARHILLRARKLRSRAILRQVLAYFDFFTPVISEVVLYLDTVTTPDVIERNLARFEDLLSSSALVKLPSVRHWLASYLGGHPAFYQSPIVKSYLDSDGDIRNRAICAKVNRHVSWVRYHKNRISNYGPWEKRAVLHAATVLSRDERRHWMEI